MRNRRGEGTVFPCIMILVLCVIISVLIYFTCAVSAIRINKENAKNVFESYITENAIEIYDSIKQGHDKTTVLDNDEYVDKLCRYCTFVKNGNMLYSYDDEGNTKYYLTVPTITFVREDTLKIKVNYTLYYPIVFGGTQVTTAVVPVEIRSSYMERF